MTPSDLLILALAVGYWSYVISRTHGAFGAFETLRKLLPLGGLTTCPVCLSFWVGVVLYLLMTTTLRPAVEVSAIAGAATLAGYYSGMWG